MKAWMTNQVFSSWLISFDSYIGQTPGRHLEAELGSTDIYKMDILSAIRICKQIWEEFSSITIRNCWKHTGLVDWDGDAQNEDGDAALDREVLETIRKLTDVGLQDVVEPLGEEEVMPETEEEELEGKHSTRNSSCMLGDVRGGNYNGRRAAQDP